MEIHPECCSNISTLRKRERAGPTENSPPPALYAAKDKKRIGMLTGTALWTTALWDFSGAWVVCNSSKTRRKQGLCCDWTSDKKMSKWTSKRHLIGHVKSSKRFGILSAGIGKFKKNLIYAKLIWNLTSKLARSTLTLPGSIRVKKLNISIYFLAHCFVAVWC